MIFLLCIFQQLQVHLRGRQGICWTEGCKARHAVVYKEVHHDAGRVSRAVVAKGFQIGNFTERGARRVIFRQELGEGEGGVARAG
jgi:hypothetical protein